MSVIRFEPTRDLRLVKAIMIHDKVWPYISDDGSPAPAEFAPCDSPHVLYLLCFDGDSLLGLWMFSQVNYVTVEVHTCLLPQHGFHRSREAAKLASQWIWDNTQCQRIVTNVPKNNRIARKFAEAAGMEQFGLNPRSFMKNGELQDQILLGISRPQEIGIDMNAKECA